MTRLKPKQKKAVSHWQLQRISSVLLLPCMAWFLYHLPLFTNGNASHLGAFFNCSNHRMAFGVTILLMLYHGMLGMEAVIEDYVHSLSTQRLCLSILHFMSFLAAILLLIAFINYEGVPASAQILSNH